MSLLAYPFFQGQPLRSYRNLNTVCFEHLRYTHLKDIAHLDRNDESLETCFALMLALRVSRSELASNADSDATL